MRLRTLVLAAVVGMGVLLGDSSQANAGLFGCGRGGCYSSCYSYSYCYYPCYSYCYYPCYSYCYYPCYSYCYYPCYGYGYGGYGGSGGYGMAGGMGQGQGQGQAQGQGGPVTVFKTSDNGPPTFAAQFADKAAAEAYIKSTLGGKGYIAQ